jgi:murein tripeptide amidase MpaA
MAYLNVTEVESAIAGLASQYPALCQRIALPHTTPEGRTCHALRIGKQGTVKSKGVLFTACQHAREWGGAEICVYFAADVLESYAASAGLQYGGKTFSAADIQQIVEQMDVFVFPCVNPDGRHYSQTQVALWRKNRNPANSGGNPACVGVDLNRNYAFLWDFLKHFHPSVTSGFSIASTDPCDFSVYHGPSTHSEPETRNVVWLLDTFPIQWFLDIHSYTGDVLYPWGDAPNQTADPGMNLMNPAYDGKRGVDDVQQYGEYISPGDLKTLEQLAHRTREAIGSVRGQRYDVRQSYYLAVAGGNNTIYPTSGTVDDYAFSRHLADPSKTKTYGFTLEFGLAPDFHPPWSEMERIVADIDAGLLAFCLEATPALLPPRLPDLVAQILFGVINDAGGVIIVGGKPIPVPPWDPWMRDALAGMLIHQLGEQISAPMGRAVQRQALEVVRRAAERRAGELG